MLCVPEYPMLSVLERKISARKKKMKKKSAWRAYRTFSCLVVAVASVLLLLLLAPLGQVDATGIELFHAYGGSSAELAQCVIEHSIDQGFVIAGRSEVTYGDGDPVIMLVKTDSVGVQLWTKTYGGSDGDPYSHYKSECVIEHSIDNGLVVAGAKEKLYDDFLLMKTDPVGVVLWTKVYEAALEDRAHQVIEHSSDKGILVFGRSSSLSGGRYHMMLVKTDSVGVVLWTKTYGGVFEEYAYSVIEHSIDNGFALLGGSRSFSNSGNWDFLLVKTDPAGVELWTKTYTPDSLFGHFVIEHSFDTGLVLAGYGYKNRYDFMLVKTDSMGVVLWTKTYGGTRDDIASSLIEHSIDQGFVVAGRTESFDVGDTDFMLVKTDPVGVVLWTKVYGGVDYEAARFVIEHSIGNGLVIAGMTGSFGAGSYDFMLVVQPSDGSGAGAGVDVTPLLIENNSSLTDISLTDINQTLWEDGDGTHTLLGTDVTLVHADQTITTTVVFGAVTSPSQTAYQSASQTASSSVSSLASSSPVVNKKKDKRGSVVVRLLSQSKLKKKKFETALQEDLADELNGDTTNAVPTARSLLDVDTDELASRVMVDELVYSRQFSNTTVDMIILNNNASNATFSVAEVVAALEAVIANPDSRLRSKGFAQADSIKSISSGSVSAGDLELCADGIRRKSCPTEDESLLDRYLVVGLIALAAVFAVVLVLLLCRRQRRAKTTNSTNGHLELDEIF